MGKYDKITEFELRFKEDSQSSGRYLGAFVETVYNFMRENPQHQLSNYANVLSEYGIEWGLVPMSEHDVSTADEKCILALLMGAVRAEDFCDGGMLIQFQKNGSLIRWLERLKELDSDESPYNLERFLLAQQNFFRTALREIQSGHKQSHWMWYIFPQIAGLGHSPLAVEYAIANMDEAKAYLSDSTLRANLIDISNALLEIDSKDATDVMGFPDDMKLRSCMTLFALAEPSCDVFQKVLDKFFHGEMDAKTIEILKRQ